MIKPFYLRAARGISAQESFDHNSLHAPMQPRQSGRMVYQEPDYRKYFTVMQLRRMSRITKIGLVTAIECLKDAQDMRPDAIITGTGKGSLQDTEKFMHAIREFEEGTLNPTPFIQSTYNALNGLIGLHHGVHSYSSTYVHRGFALENAFVDASLLFSEGNIRTSLVGSFEEMTPEHYIIKERLGFWKSAQELEEPDPLPLSPGAVAGEGCFFFFAKSEPEDCSVAVQDIHTWLSPTPEQLHKNLTELLRSNGLNWNDIDTCILGNCQDSRYDHYYEICRQAVSNTTHLLHFKHLCGEFDTATGFALWAAQRMAAENRLFPEMIWRAGTRTNLKYSLIYNHFYGQQHVAYLLKQLY